MYIVLLSGGSGKRLWPLSNELRSKQYIKILSDEKTGEQCSMVQRVWGQLTETGLAETSVVCASKGQVEILTSQLGKVNIAIEPGRRDTFPAIALACAYLKTNLGARDDEEVCIIPVDPYTDITYFETLKKLAGVLNESGSDVVLMGVDPTEPSSKFGYIVPDKTCDGYKTVSCFKEKPDTDTAKKLIEDGAVWHCGVFCTKIGTIAKHCEKYDLKLDYDIVYANYEQLPKKSFDYEVLENSNNLSVVSFSGMWKDLGTWNALAEEMKENTLGEGCQDASCQDVNVVNELDIPVVAIGLKDVIAVASFDGILIADKQSSARVKEVVDKFNFAPMYEERRWGTITVIDTSEKNGKKNTTRKIKIFEGMNSSYHYHEKRDEVWTILSGEAELIVNGIKQLISVGQVVRIPSGTKHAVRAISDIEFIEIQFGESIANDDLNRIAMDWNKIICR